MRSCEAPNHAPDCDGRGSTRDHFTPRCIAELLRWSPKEVHGRENIQYLSHACHREKDRSTPRRLEQVKKQLRGRRINLGEHEV